MHALVSRICLDAGCRIFSVKNKLQKTISVPFLVKERPYLRTVLDGIRAYLEAHGDWKIVTPQYYAGNDHPLDYIPGIVGQISGVPRPQHLVGLLARQIPTVLIGYSPQPNGASTVVLDYERIAKLAVDHFADQGVRAFAYIGSNNPLNRDHFELCQGVEQYVGTLSASFEQFDNTVPYTKASMKIHIGRIAQWLKCLPDQAGIICGDDDYANRVLLAAHLAGLRPGQDFMMIGCGNDTVFCESANPKLSSIEFDYYGMGWLAAQKLCALVLSKSEPNEALIIRSSVLRARRSSRRSGVPGGCVDQAMDLIWNRNESVVSVDLLASKLKVNRRTLDRQFNQQLQTSASVEIRKARTEKVKRLLSNERMLLATIAQDCGFYDQAHMSREFKRETGVTPLAYRNRRANTSLS